MGSVHSLLTSQANSSAASPQLMRLLPPLGCPGESVWVPPVEVTRRLQQGYRRAPIPAAPLELAWLPAAPMPQDPADSTAVQLLLQARPPLPTALTIDWGDGSVETLPWPSGDNAPRLRHAYACTKNWQVSAELSGSGISAETQRAELAVHLLGCPIWPPQPPPPPTAIQPLIHGSGLIGQSFDGRRREQWQLQRWEGGASSGGVPTSDGSSTRFLRADGTWATPPGSGGGTHWWSGDGPPGVLPDAKPGDFYLDTRSGDLYQLELS
jgi:hypothetical protein